jgi:hypothetical protein
MAYPSLGQTLIVTAGCGRMQREVGSDRGDSSRRRGLVSAGREAWHGAAPSTAVTHVAIQEALEGRSLDGTGERRTISRLIESWFLSRLIEGEGDIERDIASNSYFRYEPICSTQSHA